MIRSEGVADNRGGEKTGGDVPIHSRVRMIGVMDGLKSCKYQSLASQFTHTKRIVPK